MYCTYLNQFTQPDTIVPDPYNPQDWNRYAYARNNPVKYTDPTGHAPACEDGDDCSHKPTLTLKPRDNRNDPTDDSEDNLLPVFKFSGYTSSQPGWHEYWAYNLVCSAELHCTETQMIDYLSRFAFPGQDPNSPVRDLAVNWVFLNDLFPLGQIRTRVDGSTITNITLPDHFMHDGQVVRTPHQAADGSWYIVTRGTGNNISIPVVSGGNNPTYSLAPSQTSVVGELSLAPLNSAFGAGAFNDLDLDMLTYITENQ